MQQHPDTHNLPGSILTGGMTAAEHKGDFPDCAGQVTVAHPLTLKHARPARERIERLGERSSWRL